MNTSLSLSLYIYTDSHIHILFALTMRDILGHRMIAVTFGRYLVALSGLHAVAELASIIFGW